MRRRYSGQAHTINRWRDGLQAQMMWILVPPSSIRRWTALIWAACRMEGSPVPGGDHRLHRAGQIPSGRVAIRVL